MFRLPPAAPWTSQVVALLLPMSKAGLPRIAPLLAITRRLVVLTVPALLLIEPPSTIKLLRTRDVGRTNITGALVMFTVAAPSMMTLLRTVRDPPFIVMVAMGGAVPPPILPRRKSVFTVTMVLLKLRFPVAE